MERYAARHSDFYPQLAVLMLNAAEASGNGRYTEAVAIYDSMLRVLPQIPATQRTRSAYMKDKAEFQIEAGDCAAALKTLDEAERLTYRLDLKDIRLAFYRSVSGLTKGWAMRRRQSALPGMSTLSTIRCSRIWWLTTFRSLSI